MEARYSLYMGRKEVTEIMVGRKSVSEIRGGNTLLWKRGDDNSFRFTWTGILAIRVYGKGTVYDGTGKKYKYDTTTGLGILVRKNDEKVYTAIVNGELTNIYFFNKTNVTIDNVENFRCNVVSVLSPFPESMSKVTSFMNGLFNGCTNLISIPDNLLRNLVNLEEADKMFRNTKLDHIHPALFSTNEKITSFDSTFYNTKIKEIPEGLFDSNTEAESFKNCFAYCKVLSRIPNGLFKGLSKVKDFSACFQWLYYDFNGATAPVPERTIPADLFSGCTSAENFSSCFSGNAGIYSVPETLFDDCENAVNFKSCFSVGWWDSTWTDRYASLTYAPRLWEKFPDADGEGCFDGQTKLIWYYETPTKWRGNEKMYYPV